MTGSVSPVVAAPRGLKRACPLDIWATVARYEQTQIPVLANYLTDELGNILTDEQGERLTI